MGHSLLQAILGSAPAPKPDAGLNRARSGWDRRWQERDERLRAAAGVVPVGKEVPADLEADLLAALVRPGDEVAVAAGKDSTPLAPSARLLLDRPPRLALVKAVAADAAGNLYTGPDAGETRYLAQATCLRGGIVVAQVEQILPRVPRTDVPGEWVHFTVVAGAGGSGDVPAGTIVRDPAQLTPNQVLLALLVLRGVYARHLPAAVYHDTSAAVAAVELLLPTEGVRLGLKDQACRAWTGLPRPTLIPAVAVGVVQHALPLGSDPALAPFMAARPDVFPVDAAGHLRVEQPLVAWAAAAVDAHLAAPLAVDADGNALLPPGPDLLPASTAPLLVLVCETFGPRRQPCLVPDLAPAGSRPAAGTRVPGGRVTHLVTEAGVAHLHRCSGAEQRRAAIRAVAGYTSLGLSAAVAETAELRRLGIVVTPADLSIAPRRVDRELLAARHMQDLVSQSGGLYRAPVRLRHW